MALEQEFTNDETFFATVEKLADSIRPEREIYTLSHGQGFSYQEIAMLLQVAKGTVQTTILRVEKKIKGKVKAMKQAELYQKKG